MSAIGPNTALEMSVLGSLLMQEKNRAEILIRLSREMFVDECCKIIYEGCNSLVTDGKHLDLVTLKTWLQKHGKEVIGVMDVAQQCAMHVPDFEKGEVYAEELALLHSRRRLYSSLTRTATEIMSGQLVDTNASVIFDRVSKAAGLLESERLLVPMFDYLDGFDSSAHDKKAGEVGIPEVGIGDFDKACQIFKPSAFTVVAARPSVGKSTLMRQAAMSAADRGPVLIFSLEESNEAVRDKMLCAIAKVEYGKWYRGESTPEEKLALAVAIADLAKKPITMHGGYTCDAARVKLCIRSMIEAGNKPVAVFVDHLQLMKHPKAESRDQAVGDTTRDLRLTSLEFGVPIILLCQMNRGIDNRGNDDKRPRLSDLRESGNIEANAVNVAFLWRSSTKPEDSGNVTVTIAKHRDGPTSEFELVLLKAIGLFGQVSLGRIA